MFAVKVCGAVLPFVFTDGNVRAIEGRICQERFAGHEEKTRSLGGRSGVVARKHA